MVLSALSSTASLLKRSSISVLSEASRANVRASVNHLRHGSDIIENLTQNAGLIVVGAEYSLETGIVEFFENVPPGL